MKKLRLKESELVNLINKVINEAESHNCKCCRTGSNLPSPLGFPIHQSHRQCCKKCKDEQAGMVSSGSIRREFNEEGLIGPKTKAIQDWLDNFNDHCSCPPPYAPCGCGSAVPPSGINEVVWEQIQVAETKREVERILKVSGREREDYDSTYEINEAETADCKCCKAGVRTPPTDIISAWEAAKQHHRECCHRCEDGGGMVSNDGRRREFNEEDPGREYPTITHDEFMDGIEKYCNKNTSGCPRRCKSDKEVMNLINKWCKSV